MVRGIPCLPSQTLEPESIWSTFSTQYKINTHTHTHILWLLAKKNSGFFGSLVVDPLVADITNPVFHNAMLIAQNHKNCFLCTWWNLSGNNTKYLLINLPFLHSSILSLETKSRHPQLCLRAVSLLQLTRRSSILVSPAHRWFFFCERDIDRYRTLLFPSLKKFFTLLFIPMVTFIFKV